MNLPFPIDMMHLPALQQVDVQIFLTNNKNVNWQTWTKPRGVSACSMLAISGGGGGGGGFTRAAGNPGSGGAGGACSGITRLVIPAYFLPDELYIQVGLGGAGGNAGSDGAGGTASTVSYGRSTSAPNVILVSDNSGPSGGAGGTSGGATSGGAKGATATIRGPAALGHWAQLDGIDGANGGAGSGGNGTTVSGVWNAHVLSQGAGAAGCTTTDFAGGAVNLTAAADFAAQNIAGGTAAGVNVDGNAGIQLWQPFYMTGGSGGGSNNSGNAGKGGRAGIGCGGGGGGAGTTGGRGGDGGNGMVLIISW